MVSSNMFFCVIHLNTENCTVQAGPALKQHILAEMIPLMKMKLVSKDCFNRLIKKISPS